MTRKNNFDAMRIMAALVVIFGHAHPLSSQPDAVLLGNAVQSVAVKIFFVVSGFLVAKSWWSDPNLPRFLLRRGLRLFPALVLLLVLTVAVLGPAFTTLSIGEYARDPGTRLYFLRNLVLSPVYAVPGVFADNRYPFAVNGSLWSLPAEVLMYLLLPVVATLVALSRNRALLVPMALIGAGLCLHYLFTSPPSEQIVFWGTGSRSVADVGPYFFLGAMFTVPRLERSLDAGFALFLVAIAALFQPSSYELRQVMLMAVLPYTVLAFSTIATRGLCEAGRFGDPSYGIYLYGFPVQQSVFHLFPTMGPLRNTLVCIPIVVLLAYASWHLVEKRALALKPRKRPEDRIESKKEVVPS